MADRQTHHPPAGTKSPFKRAPSGLTTKTRIRWDVAVPLIRRMCSGEYLINIVKDYGLTLHDIQAWRDKNTKFAQWLARARELQTQAMMEESVRMFDDELPTEEIPTKNGVITRPSMAGVQNRIGKSRAMQIYAARWNKEQFGDSVQVGGSLSLVGMLSEGTKKTLKRVKGTTSPSVEAPALDVPPADSSATP